MEAGRGPGGGGGGRLRLRKRAGKTLIACEKAPRQAVDEDRADEAFLEEERVLRQRVGDLRQSIGEAGGSRDPLGLPLERLRRHADPPEPLERGGFLEVEAHLFLDDTSGDLLLEGAGHADLVREVDVLDRLFRPHALIEAESAHRLRARRRSGSEEADEGDADERPRGDGAASTNRWQTSLLQTGEDTLPVRAAARVRTKSGYDSDAR